MHTTELYNLVQYCTIKPVFNIGTTEQGGWLHFPCVTLFLCRDPLSRWVGLAEPPPPHYNMQKKKHSQMQMEQWRTYFEMWKRHAKPIRQGRWKECVVINGLLCQEG